jgi:glucose/arabinose dehydrogenase
MIYFSTGETSARWRRTRPACAARSCGLRDDGTAPPDNPFVKRAGFRPEIYSLGHRNTLGLIVHPVTGEIWNNENGPTAATR